VNNNKRLISILALSLLVAVGCKPGDQQRRKEKMQSWQEYNLIQDSLLDEVAQAYRNFEVEVGTTARRFMQTPHPQAAKKAQFEPYFNDVEAEVYRQQGSLQALQQQLSEIKHEQRALYDQMQGMESNLAMRGEQIDSLQALQAEKAFEAQTLARRLETLQASAEDFNARSAQQNQVLAEQSQLIDHRQASVKEQIERINRVYVLSGSKEELMEAGLLTKPSGLTGWLGQLEVGQSWDEKDFSPRDRRFFHAVQWKAKKAKLMTQHPEASYRWKRQRGEWKLEILDYEAFWQRSRFLLVLVD